MMVMMQVSVRQRDEMGTCVHLNGLKVYIRQQTKKTGHCDWDWDGRRFLNKEAARLIEAHGFKTRGRDVLVSLSRNACQSPCVLYLYVCVYVYVYRCQLFRDDYETTRFLAALGSW